MKKFLLLSLILLAACATPMAADPTSTPVSDALVNISTTSAILSTMASTPEKVVTATFPAPPEPSPKSISQNRVLSSDGMTQVFIQAGTLHMGGMDIFAENDELPIHDVNVRQFWMDQTEVTNGMYSLCVNAGSCRPPQKLSSTRRPIYFDGAEFSDYPVIQISWADARAYCEWAGRRLPTEAEWERAARGDDLRTYPWGDEPPTERYANFGNLIRDTSRVGSYSAGASSFGALDMAGNVWEWVFDLYDVDYYLTAPGIDPTGPAETRGRYQRVIRGGSYQDGFSDIRLSNRGYEVGPNPMAPYGSAGIYGSSSVKIGFRCASGE